jgi:hypothetical protein
MEGSFADAFNNHGAKKARWRGMARQRVQSWLIAAVQNLRLLVRKQLSPPLQAAAAARVRMDLQGPVCGVAAQIARLGRLWDGLRLALGPVPLPSGRPVCISCYTAYYKKLNWNRG